jgi:glucose-1-phosphate cytidylyltransferase
MKHYAHHEFKEFFVALGYKGEIIKRYFLDYYRLRGSLTIDLGSGRVNMHKKECEDWIVHMMDTGQQTNTGGRIKRLETWLEDGPFMVTHGDGVRDIDLRGLLRFHRAHGRLATVIAMRPAVRFSGLTFNGELVTDFTEKPQNWRRLGKWRVHGLRARDFQLPVESDGSSLERMH